MPELKLGTKFECYNCGTKFYDLGKSEPTCPKCGANQKDASSSEPTASQASRRKRKADVVAKPLDIVDEEPVEDIGDDELVGPDLAEEDLAVAGDAEEEEEDIDDED
ncbi:MAG TPA: FYDLN acid domain-containing protein [Thermoanaerobaculia bacterium]|jgi:hypothetical protein|nr:FYDLN acid domain-containing protein [Thermoanaerobaculia bacterium]